VKKDYTTENLKDGKQELWKLSQQTVQDIKGQLFVSLFKSQRGLSQKI
jgi:hypothetical protein